MTAADSIGSRVAKRGSVSHVEARCSYFSYLVNGCHWWWNWMLLWLPLRTEGGPLCLQKNKMKRILNLVPDMSALVWFMRTWPLDNFTIYGIQKLLTDLRHISWFVTVAFRNVPIWAKFMEAQWNNTLTSCHEAGCSAWHVHMGAQQCNVWIKGRVATVFLTHWEKKNKIQEREKCIF